MLAKVLHFYLCTPKLEFIVSRVASIQSLFPLKNLIHIPLIFCSRCFKSKSLICRHILRHLNLFCCSSLLHHLPVLCNRTSQDECIILVVLNVVMIFEAAFVREIILQIEVYRRHIVVDYVQPDDFAIIEVPPQIVNRIFE